jgi:hypothetical protein
VVDEARKLQGVSVAFCYCAHGDPERNDFLSVARTILFQLFAGAQNDNLVDLFYEKMSASGEIILSRSALAKELLETALGARKSYIILDGIDECIREQRRELCTWFRLAVDAHPNDLRCLFVSQDDGIAGKDLSMVPSLSITIQDNHDDIKRYCKMWHRQIKARFSPVEDSELNITELVTARSRGMRLVSSCRRIILTCA